VRDSDLRTLERLAQVGGEADRLRLELARGRFGVREPWPSGVTRTVAECVNGSARTVPGVLGWVSCYPASRCPGVLALMYYATSLRCSRTA